MIGATVVLGGVAVFTAIRLYQLRSEPVAPNAPDSQPAAGNFTNPPSSQPQLNACTALVFTLSTGTPTGTPTTTPTSTPTTTATATPTTTATPTPKACNTTCSNTAECASGLTCLDKQDGTGTKACRLSTNPLSATCQARGCNASCGENSDCESGLSCLDTGGGVRKCRDTDYPNSSSCSASTSTPTGTPIAQSTSTPASLPAAGVSTPTIIGVGAGILLLLGAFILAL